MTPGANSWRPLLPYALRFGLTVLAADLVARLSIYFAMPLNHLVTVPAAAWFVSRRFARTTGRAMTRAERLRLILLSTAALLLGGFALLAVPMPAGLPGPLLGLGATVAGGGLLVVGTVIGAASNLVLAYAGYTWLGALAARRVLGTLPEEHAASDVANPSATGMLADKDTRTTESSLRLIGMVVMWPVVALTAMLLLWLIAALLLPLFGLDGQSDTVRTGIFFGFGIILLLAFKAAVPRFTSQVFPSHRMVLWLRRFNQKNLQPFPFAPFLERACRGLAVPITLQDSIVSASAIRVRSDRGRSRMERLLAALDGHAGVPQGLTVVSCTNQEWREWVSTFVARADAILIDVTSLSESLHWELRESLRLLAPERLTLAYGHREGADPAIPPTVLEELRAVVGADAVARCSQFLYTIPRTQFRLARLFMRPDRLGGYQLPRSEQRRYEAMLANALATAFGSAGSRVPPPA